MKKPTHVVFSNIEWDTDGRKVKSLPKEVKVLVTEFESEFDFDLQGADYLSDEYGYCVFSFNFKFI